MSMIMSQKYFNVLSVRSLRSMILGNPRRELLNGWFWKLDLFWKLDFLETEVTFILC